MVVKEVHEGNGGIPCAWPSLLLLRNLSSLAEGKDQDAEACQLCGKTGSGLRQVC